MIAGCRFFCFWKQIWIWATLLWFIRDYSATTVNISEKPVVSSISITDSLTLWSINSFPGSDFLMINRTAQEMMIQIEKKALENGFNRLILQTREIMTGAVRLYVKLGYHRIQNYPLYDNLDGAVCFAKEL